MLFVIEIGKCLYVKFELGLFVKLKDLSWLFFRIYIKSKEYQEVIYYIVNQENYNLNEKCLQ